MAEERIDDQASVALQRRLDALEGEPRCARCSGSADFFLYEPDRVSMFVCWEHVSPISASVDGTLADADRPIAMALSEEFD